MKPLVADAATESELGVICSNVNQWLRLQSEEMAALMLHAQQMHVALCSELDQLTEGEMPRPDANFPPARIAMSMTVEGAELPPDPPHCKEFVVEEEPLPRLSIPAPEQAAALAGTPTAGKQPIATTPSTFSAIDAVLSARQRRISRWEGQAPPSPAPALTFGESPLPISCCDDHGDGLLQQHLSANALLRDGLERWRRGVAEVSLQRFRALGRAVGEQAAPRLALATAHRRLRDHARVCAQRRLVGLEAQAHATGGAWRRWSQRLAAAATRRDFASSMRLVARARSTHSTLVRGVQVWRHATAEASVWQASAVLLSERVCRDGMHGWCAWMRRRAAWRRAVERRAAAHGGWTRQHLPCMRGFDGRAIFLEEGSNGLAQAYRRRRVAAVLFCLWRAAATATGCGRRAKAVAPVVEAGEAAVEGDDVSSDSGDSSLSEQAWELEEP